MARTQFILNLGAGKNRKANLRDVGFSSTWILNIDRSYYSTTSIEDIELTHRNKTGILGDTEYYCNEDIFSFLERYTEHFDKIVLYRIMEHISSDVALYFIYLLSNILKDDGKIEIICPDYNKLARLLIVSDDDIKNDKFSEKREILLQTEIFNTKDDPHQLITTPIRLKRLLELENYFKVTKITPTIVFDNRDIYFHMEAKRVERQVLI